MKRAFWKSPFLAFYIILALFRGFCNREVFHYFYATVLICGIKGGIIKLTIGS